MSGLVCVVLCPVLYTRTPETILPTEDSQTPSALGCPHLGHMDLLSGGWGPARPWQGLTAVWAGNNGAGSGMCSRREGNTASWTSLRYSSGAVFRDSYSLSGWTKQGTLKHGAPDRTPRAHV